MTRIVSAILILLAAGTSAFAGDWPQFLGPDRNGVSTETGLINVWPESGPEIVWRRPLGVGMSGIAVVGGTAWTLFQDDTTQYVVALNAKSGEERWKTAVAPTYKNSMGNGPRATPTVGDDQVFAFTGEGILVCLNRQTGRQIWSVDTRKEWGGRDAEYGMACSPLISGEFVVVTVGMPDATVAAFERKSGKVAWTSGKGSPAGYSSPALLTLNGKNQLVVFHGAGVLSLTPETGTPLWNYEYPTDYNCNIATPIAVENEVFISSGENHGSALLSVPETSTGDVTETWTSFGPQSVFRNEWQTALLIDGNLYGFDNVGSAGPVTNLNCVNAKTGELRWRQRRFGKGNAIAADGKLWCTTMDGELVIVQATPNKFVELSRAPLFGETRQAPSLANGLLYVRDNAEMVCVKIRE
ncbi:MAG: PQQ-binding-like beta-propeller repeat protein [Planctomycetaceae bacterium]|nr:PQQ-binding-like beta-propeller repeat protein [Planctomycetaceae bacterium]